MRRRTFSPSLRACNAVRAGGHFAGLSGIQDVRGLIKFRVQKHCRRTVIGQEPGEGDDHPLDPIVLVAIGQDAAGISGCVIGLDLAG
jgi:hypothetical protein